MAEVKTVVLVNKKDRAFNGIRPGQVVEVALHDADAYINVWFEKLENISTPEDPEGWVKEEKLSDLTVPELHELIAKNAETLKVAWVAVPAKFKNKAEILEFIDANITQNKKAPENAWGVDYAKLLTDAKIEFKAGDDLKKLAEENGLL